jgi:hypothetical protein
VTRTAIWLLISVVALAVVWLAAGRRVALLLDGLVTGPAVSLPIAPLAYDGGGFVIGGTSMTFAETNNLRGDTDAIPDSGRVVFTSGQNRFMMGPLVAPAPSGRPEFTFRPESGDVVSFTVSKSLLPWPTPFEFKMLGGSSPWWRQHVHYRLAWKKPSGTQLEMLWRFECEYYAGKGWTEPQMMWNSQTGLLLVNMRGS